MKNIAFKVEGKVQGVYFRASTKEKAQSLDIKGFVRNESDGSVYGEAQGSEKAMEEFINWLHKGPSNANVESLKQWSLDGKKDYIDFVVSY